MQISTIMKKKLEEEKPDFLPPPCRVLLSKETSPDNDKIIEICHAEKPQILLTFSSSLKNDHSLGNLLKEKRNSQTPSQMASSHLSQGEFSQQSQMVLMIHPPQMVSKIVQEQDFNKKENDEICFKKDCKKVIELLDIVFNNPSCKAVKEWLEDNKPISGRSFSLISSDFIESYFSKKQNRRINIFNRVRKNITPLEAAAISGDNFLIRTLLEFIPDNQKYKAGLLLLRARRSSEYLEPYHILQHAYEQYIKDESELSELINLKRLEESELQIGLCQRELPAYGIQEFCDDKPFYPLPNFDKEPKRSCLSPDGTEINLDLIGSKRVLYKGAGHGSIDEKALSSCLCFSSAGIWCAGGYCACVDDVRKHDLLAIIHLCEVRSKDLDKIIECLLKFKPNTMDQFELQIMKEFEENRKLYYTW